MITEQDLIRYRDILLGKSKERVIVRYWGYPDQDASEELQAINQLIIEGKKPILRLSHVSAEADIQMIFLPPEEESQNYEGCSCLRGRENP